MSGEFINPYNFARIDEGNCLKKGFIDFKKFHDGYLSGRLICEIKSVGEIPLFIPDTEKEQYAILLNDVPTTEVEKMINAKNLDLKNEYLFRRNRGKLEIVEKEPSIPDDLSNLQAIAEAIKECFGTVRGRFAKIKVDLKGKEVYAIITDDPKAYRADSHRLLSFCREPSGKPMIPSTSIKGAIHTLIETLSNSCMAHVEDRSILHRLDPKYDQSEIGSLSRGSYIVIKRDEDGASLLKLDSAKVTTDYCLEVELEKASGSDAHAVIAKDSTGRFKCVKRIGKKSAMDKCRDGFQGYLKRRGRNETCEVVALTSANINILSKDNYHIKVDVTVNGVQKEYFEPRLFDKDAKKVYALIYYKKNIRKYYVKAVQSDKSALKALQKSNPSFKGLSLVEARVKRSGSIETKTQDILFFKYYKDDLGAYLNKVKGLLQENPSDPLLRDVIKVGGDAAKSYEQILKDRKENLKKQDEPDSLNEGDLVYYHSGNGYLSYTQIPRKKYRYSIGDLIRNKACNRLNNLCPACSIFGTTETVENGRKTAISGRVSFGMGRLVSINHILEEDVPLKILSSPKPSCKEFYLVMEGGNYNNQDSQIRGRKFYYHHDVNRLDYRMKDGDFKGDEIINTQNVSIEILKNFNFEFTIDFINFSPYELGLLLFALDLKDKDDKKIYHKLGMGKPLGLGSVEIEIDKERSFLINRSERYIDLFSDGKETLNIDSFVDQFKQTQHERYNRSRPENEKKNNFYSIPYISDLFDVLSVNIILTGYDDIKYPRKTENREPRGFQWFVDEIKKKRLPQTLPEPDGVRRKTRQLTKWS
ncbi:MAG: TIGR03986 family CRISPR-associated RAMP protein [Nitrospirae bacterium]|nr:TIGR03986 family CRISPR-associated RAMP protein [Nitrospirota bacterium]